VLYRMKTDWLCAAGDIGFKNGPQPGDFNKSRSAA